MNITESLQSGIKRESPSRQSQQGPDVTWVSSSAAPAGPSWKLQTMRKATFAFSYLKVPTVAVVERLEIVVGSGDERHHFEFFLPGPERKAE